MLSISRHDRRQCLLSNHWLMVKSGTVLITYLLGSHLKRDIKNTHLVTSRKWITDTEWLVKLQSTDRNNSLKLCLSELFHSQFLRYRGSKNNKNRIKKEEKGKHFFSALSPLSNALLGKCFRVKIKCVFFFSREGCWQDLCVSYLSNAVSYKFRDDKLIFPFCILTKLVNTPLSVGKLGFILISLISGPAVCMWLNLPAGQEYCRQAMSYFYLEMKNVVSVWEN